MEGIDSLTIDTITQGIVCWSFPRGAISAIEKGKHPSKG